MTARNHLKHKFVHLRKRAKRIFNISYEDISTQIYYDVKHTFKLIILRNDQHLLLEREISRAEAFRIMNTRP